jgi:hypothetical protein
MLKHEGKTNKFMNISCSKLDYWIKYTEYFKDFLVFEEGAWPAM